MILRPSVTAVTVLQGYKPADRDAGPAPARWSEFPEECGHIFRNPHSTSEMTSRVLRIMVLART